MRSMYLFLSALKIETRFHHCRAHLHFIINSKKSFC